MQRGSSTATVVDDPGLRDSGSTSEFYGLDHVRVHGSVSVAPDETTSNCRQTSTFQGVHMAIVPNRI